MNYLRRPNGDVIASASARGNPRMPALGLNYGFIL